MFDFTFNIRQKTQFICHVTNVRFHHEILFLSRYCFVYDSVFKNKLSHLQRKNNKKSYMEIQSFRSILFINPKTYTKIKCRKHMTRFFNTIKEKLGFQKRTFIKQIVIQ